MRRRTKKRSSRRRRIARTSLPAAANIIPKQQMVAEEVPVLPPQITQPEQKNPGFFAGLRRNWGKIALGLGAGALLGGAAAYYNNSNNNNNKTYSLVKLKQPSYVRIEPFTDDERQYIQNKQPFPMTEDERVLRLATERKENL